MTLEVQSLISHYPASWHPASSTKIFPRWCSDDIHPSWIPACAGMKLEVQSLTSRYPASWHTESSTKFSLRWCSMIFTLTGSPPARG
jgi:hypothetical protein